MHPKFPTSRTDLIDLLGNLDVAIPKDTKLDVKGLEEKLRSALDDSQDANSIPGLMDQDGLVNVGSLPLYDLEPGQKMVDQVRRHTVGEAMENQRRDRLGINPHLYPGKQAFYDLRQTLMHLGMQFDEGRLRHIIKDTDDSSAICMRVIEVRQAAPQTPLFLVLYCHDLKGQFPAHGLPWIEDLIQSGPVPMTKASIQEQHLLIRLLDRNAKRVPPSLQPKRESTEKNFTLSFLLPVAPLSDDGRDTIGIDAPDSCAVCGVPTTSHCSGCRAIRYCSPEHAKQNWKSHKSVCKSLKGATWITLPFNPRNSTQSTQSMVTLNHRAVFQGPRAAKPSIRQDTDITPNPYGSQPFLLKLQLPISSPEAIMLIYDQTRAIQLNIFRANTPLDVWSKIEDVCQAEGALKGLKLYVWARRKSDMEFSIAIDRLPDQQTIPW